MHVCMYMCMCMRFQMPQCPVHGDLEDKSVELFSSLFYVGSKDHTGI